MNRPIWCRKELGHVVLHGPGQPEFAADAAMHRGIAEVDAEPVALMVGAAQLATDGYTVPYVASWASSVPGETPVGVVGSTAERVRSAAVTILDRLDTAQVTDGNPTGLERETRAVKREAPTPVATLRPEPAAPPAGPMGVRL